MDALVNQVVKGYRLIERIGAGGFGTVYRAMQLAVGREVAIKVIAPDQASQPSFIRRFEIEAQLVARLEHPHIVPLYDYWRDPSGAYLVMRLLRGNLRAALHGGPWSVMTTAQLVDQIAGALTIAHRNGIIHRDIKPDNILLDEDNNAYLTDFGIAKAIGMTEQITAAGMMVGSPAYITPEQIRSEPVSPQTDIYSLGLVIYETLTGEKPFNKATTPDELVACHLAEPLPSVHQICPDLPAVLDAIIQTATAKLPGHRYSDSLRLASAFRAAIPSPDRQLPRQPLADPLTEREIEILGLLQEGLTNGEIAARLVLSLTTVKWYLRQIFSKLDVHDRYKAVERALQLGLFGAGRLTEPVHVAPLPAVVEPTVVEVKAPAKNPFKGLYAYQEADAADFFGREALTRKLVARLAGTGDTARFVAVVGPSGSGKSSVVRAGLVPALVRGDVPGAAEWFIVDMLPGTHPLEELEAALLRLAVNPPESLIGQLREDERGLARALKRVLPDQESELLLFIDQFEEVFTLIADEAERLHFLDSLYAAVTEPRGRLRIVITLRADFYDRPLLYEHIGRLLPACTEWVLPLSTEELTQVIMRPTKRAGISVEPELLAALLKDAGEQPGTLPLLQYALTELFEHRIGNSLTMAAYRASGGLSGALARRADAILGQLEPAVQETARQIFLRLVTPGEGVEDTRRRVQITEMATLPDAERAGEEVLDAFGRYRLLSFDRDPLTRGPTVEVAHEALIRTWGQLRAWLDASREALYIQRRLLAAATEWARAGRDPSFLASGTRLAQFEALPANAGIALNQEERAYLAASTAERERLEIAQRAQQAQKLALERRAANRLRSLVGVLAAFLLVAAVLSAVTWTSRAELATRITRSEAERLALASSDLRQGESPDSALVALLAIRALRTQYTPYGDAALTAAAQLDYPAVYTDIGDNLALVNDVDMSPDGRYLLTLSIRPDQDSNQIWLWDTRTRNKIRRFTGHTGVVWNAAFVANARYILTAGADRTVRLWETETGTEFRRFVVDGEAVWNAAYDGDTGRVLAVGVSKTGDETLWWWDSQSGAELPGMTLSLKDSDVSIFPEHAANGRLLAFALGNLDAVEIWDTQTGRVIRRFEAAPAITSMAFSPDGKYLATGGGDRIVRVWDLRTGKELLSLHGHQGAVRQLAFSPDGRYLLSGTRGDDLTMRQWDIESGQEVLKWSLGWFCEDVSFTPDGQSVLVGSDEGTAVMLTLDPSEKPHILVHPDKVRNVTYSPDGRYILTAGGDALARLWDARTGQEVRRFVGHTASVNGVFFAPDGARVLTASSDGAYRLWDARSGETTRTFPDYTGNYVGDFSRDGRYLLLAVGELNVGGSVVIWDLQAGKEVQRFFVSPTAVYCAWFSPDGRYVLTGGAAAHFALWDAQTGTEMRQLSKRIEVDGGRCGAFSPDGQYVFAGGNDGIGRLYRTDTGEEVRRFVGHSGIIVFVAYSPDGRYVATTGGDDSTARLWEVQTGQEVRRFTGHTGAVWGVAFSPDGKYIVTGGWNDRTARVWQTDINSQMLDLCARLTRDFTDIERARFRIPDITPTCPLPGESFP